MRARWIISAILVILPAGSPSAQQSHLDTRYQIEQTAATFADHYNKQDAACSREHVYQRRSASFIRRDCR
jgi:hypothetical protein